MLMKIENKFKIFGKGNEKWNKECTQIYINYKLEL